MIDDELWDDFHHMVNMSSRELSDWLRTESATPEGEEVPDRAGSPLGQKVLRILRKRRVDLTNDDQQVMREVVERVHAQRREDLEPTAGDATWRHRLMDIGHDPLRPADRPV